MHKVLGYNVKLDNCKSIMHTQTCQRKQQSTCAWKDSANKAPNEHACQLFLPRGYMSSIASFKITDTAPQFHIAISPPLLAWIIKKLTSVTALVNPIKWYLVQLSQHLFKSHSTPGVTHWNLGVPVKKKPPANWIPLGINTNAHVNT